MAICVLRTVNRICLNYYLVQGSRCMLSCRLQSSDSSTGQPVSSSIVSAKESSEKEQHKYEENIRHKILEAALPFVHELGWSKNAISAGANSLGYPGVIHGMFPQGGADLVSYFYSSCNQKLTVLLAKQMKQAEQNKSSPKEPPVFVRDAVELRLRMNTPYLAHWPQALALMTLPPNVPTALANLLTMVDDICYFAGDRSVDFNWYSRRVALAAIYKMTELFMMQDQSADHVNTWQFLTRRIDEAAQVHTVMVQSETGVQFAKEVASATFTTARNILGLNR